MITYDAPKKPPCSLFIISMTVTPQLHTSDSLEYTKLRNDSGADLEYEKSSRFLTISMQNDL